MTFNSDELRRNVAANIRSAANRRKNDLQDDPDYSPFAALFAVFCGVRGWPHYEDLLHLADLIDRQTCTIACECDAYSSYGERIDGMRLYELSCGHQAVGFEKPRYCPKCGAVIVDE